MTTFPFLRTLRFPLAAFVLIQCGSSGGAAPDGGSTTGPDGAKGADGGSTTGPDGGGSHKDGSGAQIDAPKSEGDASVGGAQSVLQRGHDLYRQATYVESGLTKTAAASMALDTAFNGNATYTMSGSAENRGTGSVLYLEDGPTAKGCPTGSAGCVATGRAAGNGLFFAFPASGNANPNVIAFDETTGDAVWTAHLMTGGDGLRGTPVIDPVARRLYAVTGNNPHLVHAVSVDTGVEVMTGDWPVTLSSTTVSYNGASFNSQGENQHGALLLANDILYIPFGGEYGDGGTYLGWVIAVDTTNPSRVAGWATESPRSGIWGSGGLASDGQGVFAVTGDTTSVARAMSDSQEVVRLTGMASFTRNAQSVFVPTEWEGWDRPAGDLDFGASTPAYVRLPPGSTPSALLVAPAKAGRVFLLDGTNLSSGTYDTNRTPGGALADIVVSGTMNETVYTAPTIYSSGSGLHATIDVGGGQASCPSPAPTTEEVIESILIQPGKSPLGAVTWCTAVQNGGGHMNFPPISTTTDGVSANALVWSMDGAQLVALDGDTGAKVFTSTGAGCANVPSMSFPIAAKNRIVVASLSGLCSWSLGGK